MAPGHLCLRLDHSDLEDPAALVGQLDHGVLSARYYLPAKQGQFYDDKAKGKGESQGIPGQPNYKKVLTNFKDASAKCKLISRSH